MRTTNPSIQAVFPFFIIGNVDRTIALYRDQLGFETRFQQPAQDPFFAIIGREGTQVFMQCRAPLAQLQGG